MELANKLDWLTGGADGLQGVVMGPLLLGAFEFDLYGRAAAVVLAGSAAGVLPALRAGSFSSPAAARRCVAHRVTTALRAHGASACR
jgi:hypothetical protein